MRWLAENGVAHDFDSYLDLPVGVLEDCRLVMVYEARALARQERANNAVRR
jgi:hypothetical protein